MIVRLLVVTITGSGDNSIFYVYFFSMAFCFEMFWGWMEEMDDWDVLRKWLLEGIAFRHPISYLIWTWYLNFESLMGLQHALKNADSWACLKATRLPRFLRWKSGAFCQGKPASLATAFFSRWCHHDVRSRQVWSGGLAWGDFGHFFVPRAGFATNDPFLWRLLLLDNITLRDANPVIPG